ncbi:hypothetical protein [Tuwongella immobilis]|uniref:Uncharacterized protein n=1 Tax=Tuwongella immobilis TaxID=692036 RepID=A0A6C2YKF2_9BACT|nr:hypothetical protein [Tuwongella immobilis]VIP01781.1 unnamed protein product [Tuwongella immobilis]VTR99430.1 unnamed protein product [Tuwongella immobilis]
MLGLFAAAGLAEAAWAMAMVQIFLTFAVVGFVAGVALVCRSRTIAEGAALLWVCGTLFWKPWLCFQPFDDSASTDPDVVSAAAGFRNVGFVWVAVSAGVACSLVVAMLRPRRQPEQVAAGGVAPDTDPGAAADSGA